MTCKKVTRLEQISCALVIGASILLVFDPTAQRIGKPSSPLFDLVALTANIPGVLFWVFNKALQNEEVSTITIITSQTLGLCIVFNILAISVEGAKFEISNEGIFGFLMPENLTISLFWYSFFAGFFG